MERNVEVAELVDVEEYAKDEREKPKKAKKWRIRIDREKYEVDVSSMTGRELLTLANKIPVENFLISQKLHGGQAQRIALDETVDFTAPGIERFMTMVLDQQDGEPR